MAKANPIILAEGSPDTDLAKSVLRAESLSATLGALVADVFAKAATAKQTVVAFVERLCGVYEGIEAVDLLTVGGRILGTLTRDDADKRVSTWTFVSSGVLDPVATAEEIAWRAAVAAAVAAPTEKPARSVASMVNVLEDILPDTLPDNPRAIVTQIAPGAIYLVAGGAAGMVDDAEEIFAQDADELESTPPVMPFE